MVFYLSDTVALGSIPLSLNQSMSHDRSHSRTFPIAASHYEAYEDMSKCLFKLENLTLFPLFKSTSILSDISASHIIISIVVLRAFLIRPLFYRPLPSLVLL
ncbi:hypothetical protein EDC94DRAFT_580800 [Helicostylum pulchrum]|nr:hypothetical protein EDC94DRAFT_580800 [Helicostylum pulchrum]